MYRKIKKPIIYEKDGVKIRRASLGEEYEVGGWITSYSWIKLGYENDKYEPKYSDIIYVMIVNHEIIGYFIVFNIINMDENNIVPLYAKELFLYDFVVDIRAYSKYSKILIDFMLNYAQQNGYYAITINKIEKYKFFNEFINRHYKLVETKDNYYFMINNPIISSCQKHLTIYDNDKIQLENLYFLYDLNFDILKTKCILKVNENEFIEIDRLTGLISFPSNIKLNKDQLILNYYTKELIYVIVSLYDINKVNEITIDYDINNPNYYEASINGELHVSKNYEEIRDDSEYKNSLIKRGYNMVVPRQLRYEMNDSSFSICATIYKLVK